jgi:hypothetical protein
MSQQDDPGRKFLPFRTTTATGNQFDFEFALHPETASPVQVSNLLSALLETLDREIGQLGDVGNGDVLQALAMALVVRTRMLGPGSDRIDGLVRELVESALASSVRPGPGNLPPDQDPAVH